MDIFTIITLAGGLALTLFGMNVMSGGLERLSGGMLERTLERATDHKGKAVLLGAGVTALIQSSSATTVMVVGFVNSGIMKLEQAVGLIMGANIGTTITAWILSLAGLSGDSVFIKLLKPTSFAPILALIGAGLLLFSKRDKRKNAGTILCGFAVLMSGMTTMTTAMQPLAELPGFAGLMTRFSNPLLGLLVGAAFTGIIQSSAAAIGILQALSVTGAITFGAAIPIILGQNIGTCVTALLSCIGANQNAKRTAMVHLYFNLIGTLFFLGLFYGARLFVPMPFLAEPLSPAYIALVHTIFNLVATGALLPFSNVLARLATKSIPEQKMGKGSEKKDSKDLQLDERFLSMPAFAAERCRHTACDMALLAWETIVLALDLVQHYDEVTEKKILENEERLDIYEDRLGAYLVKLSCEKLLPSDSRRIGEYLHVIGDFERIGDHAVNLTEVAQEIHKKRLTFSPAALSELAVFDAALREVLDLSFRSFLNESVDTAKSVEPLEEVVDGLCVELRSRHVQRLQRGVCTIELGFVLSDLLTNLERIADHCSNIAACLIQTSVGAFDMHSYLESVKSAANGALFQSQVRKFSDQYMLPENTYVN